MKFALMGIGCGLLLFGITVAAWFITPQRDPAAGVAFIDTYALYDEIMQEQAGVVFAPGHGDNDLRGDLFRTLDAILTEEFSDEARVERTREALALTEALKREIDAVAATRQRAEAAIADIERAADTLPTGAAQDEAQAVVQLLNERQMLVTDITATLYAINSHTEAILTRIIAENGALTDEHVAAINGEVAEAEARFDRLSGLYRQLGEVRQAIEAAHHSFIAAAL